MAKKKKKKKQTKPKPKPKIRVAPPDDPELALIANWT
jgi:hypothetical protein